MRTTVATTRSVDPANTPSEMATAEPASSPGSARSTKEGWVGFGIGVGDVGRFGTDAPRSDDVADEE